MPCCCSNILPLGCIGTCTDDRLSTGNIATVTGEYKLFIDFHGRVYIVFALIVEGDEITFPTDRLNESYEYQGYIVDPSGAFLTLTSNGLEYDCLSFKTVQEFALNEITAS